MSATSEKTSSIRERWTSPLLAGLVATVALVGADLLGLLGTLESWLYDRRARFCQVWTPPPSPDIVHLDIDDPSLKQIGRWPWSRTTLATIVEQVARCKPRAIVLDLTLDRPEKPTIQRLPDNTYAESQPDPMLGQAIASAGNVIVPMSFSFEEYAVLQRSATAVLAAQPATTRQALRERLKFQARDAGEEAHLDRLFEQARESVVYDRLMRRMETSTAGGLAEVDLAGAAAEIFGQPSVADQRLVAQVAAKARAGALLKRFALQQGTATDLPVLRADDEQPPVYEVISAAASVGFVNYLPSGDGKVRSVPLVIQSRGRLYPQLGLALACQMLGVRASDVQVDRSWVWFKTPQGRHVRIPTRLETLSPPYDGQVAVMDIVWRGPPQWEAMYHDPRDPRFNRHLPITLAWDLAQQRPRLARNREIAGRAMADLLRWAQQEAPGAVPLPATRADAPSEPEFLAMIERVITAFDDPARLPSQRPPWTSAALGALGRFRTDQQAFDREETLLTRLLQGRAVFVGSVASELKDVVPTSIHANCPGVVVHGLIANSILTGDAWRRAPKWIGVLLTLLIGSLSAWVSSRLAPIYTVLVTAGMAAVYLVFNGLVLFDWGNLIVDGAGPALAAGVAWSVCIAARLVREGLERIRIGREAAAYKREMDLARSVQEALIPQRMPALPGFDIAGWTQAASTCGGDCFDLWLLPDGRLGILLGDASGHGLGPAMVISQVRALIRMLADADHSPYAILERVNHRVAHDVECGTFATVFIGFLSSDGHLEWASAGHGPTLFKRRADSPWEMLDTTGMPVGMMDDWLLTADPAPAPVQLEQGGALVVLSDGIFESPNPPPALELFGIERVQALLETADDQSCAQTIHRVRDAVSQWHDAPELADDHTLVLIRRAIAPQPASSLPSTTAACTEPAPATPA